MVGTAVCAWPCVRAYVRACVAYPRKIQRQQDRSPVPRRRTVVMYSSVAQWCKMNRVSVGHQIYMNICADQILSGRKQE